MATSGRRRIGYFVGSKATSGLCQPVIAMMPPHDTDIETHLGGGAIMQRGGGGGVLRNIGIDLYAPVIEGFSCDYPVKLVHGCAHRFLAECPVQGRELVYCDPPYLHEVRRGPRRYRYDYEQANRLALLGLLKELACQVVLSGYPSAFYDEHLAEWRSVSVQVNNQAGVVAEKIWFNFEPDRLHWASLAGRNHTHRQSIKRKAANWGHRYAGMPRAERLAALAEIMVAEAEG